MRAHWRSFSGFLLAAAWLLSACNSTKWVQPGERLLVRNTVNVPSGSLDPDDLASIVKQKPNKRVLGRPLYLDLYNIRDPRKVERKRAEADSLCLEKNKELRFKGKKEKACDRSSRGRNGEAPVILDSTLTARTVEQFELYAFKEGYFKAEVADTVHLRHRKYFSSSKHGRPYKKPKAAVEYTIVPGRYWSYCTIDLRCDDPDIKRYLKEVEGETLLKPGDRFDGDVLEKERTRITDWLRHVGYLYFTRDMVLFDADTSAGDHEVDLLVSLERPTNVGARGLKGTAEGRVYHLNEVYVDATLRTTANQHEVPDTMRLENYTFLYLGDRPRYKPKALVRALYLRPYERYNQNDYTNSFRRLTALRVFDRVDIAFDTTGLRRNDLADCRIRLLPSKRQGFSTEINGTNRGGFLGASLNFNYKHRNLFRRMALLQASMTFGVEAQQQLNTSTASEDASTALGRDALFNTLEFGPEVKLSFPNPWRKVSQRSGSKLVLNTLYNYQRRPDYTRTLLKGSVGFEWNPSLEESAGFYPAEINLIRIPKRSQQFEDFLNNTNDPILSNSYTDHVILGMRGVWSLNTQLGEKRRRQHNFIRVSGDLAGTVIFLPPPVWVGWLASEAQDAETGEQYRTIAGIRYAQYIKGDVDWRHYWTIHEKSSFVTRMSMGYAKPFGNQTTMPFETSFFSGGANGMRAWRARSLGPGSYTSPTNNFDRIGEVRLEGNVEYRFKVFGYLEGALFADAGNIWYQQDVPSKPGGRFRWESFASEIAVGTGLGARLNFDFFLVRFDLGLQTKDPSLPPGQRWLFDKKDPALETSFGQKLNFNLGIGYPF